MKRSGSSDVPNLNSNVYLKYIFFSGIVTISALSCNIEKRPPSDCEVTKL